MLCSQTACEATNLSLITVEKLSMLNLMLIVREMCQKCSPGAKMSLIVVSQTIQRTSGAARRADWLERCWWLGPTEPTQTVSCEEMWWIEWSPSQHLFNPKYTEFKRLNGVTRLPVLCTVCHHCAGSTRCINVDVSLLVGSRFLFYRGR